MSTSEEIAALAAEAIEHEGETPEYAKGSPLVALARAYQKEREARGKAGEERDEARAEAEALRRGIEAELQHAEEGSTFTLQRLLDRVDAAGSLALLEELHSGRAARARIARLEAALRAAKLVHSTECWHVWRGESCCCGAGTHNAAIEAELAPPPIPNKEAIQ